MPLLIRVCTIVQPALFYDASCTMLSLTTTSYSVLSHLALKPWSAYELAVQRVRYFRYFWPRAERGIYDELKRLATAGLARAETGYTGRRQRTVYSITPTGIDALRQWLDTPLTPVALEFEGLLRIFASPLGTVSQLRANLERIREDVESMTAFNDAIAQEYMEGRAPFQAQAHVRTLVVDFLTDFMAVLEAWVERSSREVEGWKDLSSASNAERPVERLAAAKHRRARLRRRGGAG
jgi:PadR family transcriptional regulator, regulatory protein AphA